MTEKEEQIQRNCEQIQQLLNKYPNRRISITRIEEDKCQIRLRNTKLIIFKGDTAETLHEARRLLEPDPKLEDNNFKRVQDIAKQFPQSKIMIERVNKEICRIHASWGSITFNLSVLNSRIERDIECVKEVFIEETKQNQ